jgi:MFS transporter, OFA family, oxalate/formate antiporter
MRILAALGWAAYIRVDSFEARTAHRWAVAFAAVVVMLTLGTLYSWGIFTQPLLVAYGWNLTVTTSAYAFANFSLAAVGATIGGFWQDRVGPRTVAMTGVTLWGMGNVLAGLGTSALGAPWLYLSYGLIGGIGAGMAYVAPLAMVAKWFPDMKGVAGGLVAGGFGLGAFLYNQVVPRLPAFHTAAVHAGNYVAAKAAAGGRALDPTLTAAQMLSSADIGAVMHVLIVSGVIYLIAGLPAAALFRDPPPNFSLPAAPRSARSPAEHYSPTQMVMTSQFYLMWLQLFINALAGITLISNAVVILSDLTQRPAAMIAPLFGLASIFNALGRVVWGLVSDRIGCNHAFAAMFAIQAVTLFLLSDVHDLTPALVGFSVILLCCGGGFGTMPSYNAQYFGTKFLGLNYALILSAWGFAGLIGPIIAAQAKDIFGSFAGILPLFALVLSLSIVLPYVTRKPGARTERAIHPMRVPTS